MHQSSRGSCKLKSMSGAKKRLNFVVDNSLAMLSSDDEEDEPPQGSISTIAHQSTGPKPASASAQPDDGLMVAMEKRLVKSVNEIVRQALAVEPRQQQNPLPLPPPPIVIPPAAPALPLASAAGLVEHARSIANIFEIFHVPTTLDLLQTSHDAHQFQLDAQLRLHNNMNLQQHQHRQFYYPDRRFDYPPRPAHAPAAPPRSFPPRRFSPPRYSTSESDQFASDCKLSRSRTCHTYLHQGIRTRQAQGGPTSSGRTYSKLTSIIMATPGNIRNCMHAELTESK
jgi:hypothetical protein